jgi:hypothetical protein
MGLIVRFNGSCAFTISISERETNITERISNKANVVVTDFMMKVKMGKKIHLCEYETDSLAEGLMSFLNVRLRFQE